MFSLRTRCKKKRLVLHIPSPNHLDYTINGQTPHVLCLPSPGPVLCLEEASGSAGVSILGVLWRESAGGGRWNRKGTPVVYTSSTRALACLEVLANLAHGGLPLNRYLVQILIPIEQWKLAVRFDPAAGIGWDALQPGLVSLDWGTQWDMHLESSSRTK